MDNELRFLRRFGRRIAAFRQARGTIQEQLAEIVGVDRTYISYVENGKRNPSIANVRRIARALGVSLRELFESF